MTNGATPSYEEQIVRSISELCFDKTPCESKKDFHFELVRDLGRYFIGQGYRIQWEAPITFASRSSQSGFIPQREGYLDLTAERDGLKISIEYDNCNVLKWKSIEKLVQSDCNICVGIIRGNLKEQHNESENIERITSVIKAYPIIDKSFWFILNSTRKSLKIK